MSADKPNLRLAFVGDDFTGSTDAMESLARAGWRTVLFTAPPTRGQLQRYPDLQAFGVAGTTRSMPPDQMEPALRPVFEALRELQPPIVHYKVCSTFDSSPTVGSIGRVIDIGADIFGSLFVPLVVGAPSLGRYCVFGNLFARLGADGELYRLDRHPSMSRHPTTPMDEADLRVHLAKQTTRKIGLLDVRDLALPWEGVAQALDAAARGKDIVLIDLLYESQEATVGRLIVEAPGGRSPHFVVGSSGVESALAAHWRESRQIEGTARFAMPFDKPFDKPGAAAPILAVCGSCSPVTAGQVRWAVEHGFVEISDLDRAVTPAINALRHGRSVVVHTGEVNPSAVGALSAILGKILREVLSGAPDLRRVLVAGGDTSGQIARSLGIESMEMIAELTRGSPLVRVAAPGSPADGLEMTFKGGQIGGVDFFGAVARGNAMT